MGQNVEYYMMFEVLEPNWHVLQQKLKAARRVDELVAHHNAFLDTCLKECMLRDPTLLKLLAKLLTYCVIFADQTRAVMHEVARLIEATPIASVSARRSEQVRAAEAAVSSAVEELRYNANVAKLRAKFDEELKLLLAELGKQA